MKQRIPYLFIFLILFTSCYKEHLYVQQQWVDRNFLASSHVGTPDPRQESPPTGQRLLVAWRFPFYQVQQGLNMVLTVRFWDQSEEQFSRSLQSSQGSASFDFFDQKILTYRVQVIDRKGDIIETWEHHFWTQAISPPFSQKEGKDIHLPVERSRSSGVG